VNAGEQYVLFITPFVADQGFNHRATLTFQGGLIETYGADAFEQVEACTLGVGEYGLDVVEVYPNPVTTTLHVIAKTPIDSVVVYNLLGQEVLRSKMGAGALTETIDMSGFESGVYLVRVFVGGGVETFRVLKE
jgi:hypothetical protein